MPSRVHHQVEHANRYPVVRLAGVLDADSAPLLRSALLDVLATQPTAMIVDVGEVSVPDPENVAVLGEVARACADWPGAGLLLSAPGVPDPWRATGLPVWRTPDAAIAELGDPEPGARLSLDLEPLVGAARQARQLVTEACLRWDVPGLAGPGSIVVTELVNNVVVHARTPMTVLLGRTGDMLRVAVRDRSAGAPRYAGPPPPTAYGGRGLLLIDTMADRWGSLHLADGKVVWAVLPVPADTVSTGPGTGPPRTNRSTVHRPG